MPDKQYALRIENLSKTYTNDVQALDNVSFNVKAGDFFALLGPNGAGKSTTISIIASLVKKTSGLVDVFGYDIDKKHTAAKQMLGLVPQEFNFNIFETVQQVVVNQAGYYGIPYKLACERAEYYLNQMGIWDKRHTVTQNLSGGMKRRLMIARALMHQPKLLILDEPTAGVDVELRHFLWDFLERLNTDGTTIILTTHYLEEAESLCRNILIINHGKVIIDTDKRTLLNKLHKETILLTCKTPWQQLPEVSGFTIEALDKHTLSVQVPHGNMLNILFAALTSANIEITSVRNKTNPLEEMFLNLTAGEHP